LATAQFEIEGKDLALAALNDFRRSTADFSDCLLGRRNRGAGAVETATFDRGLRGLEGSRLL
jgi:predicted nucleic-acid-binding protein